MKQAAFRFAFIGSVLVILSILGLLSIVAMDQLLPFRPGPDGLYASNDRRSMPGFILFLGCLLVANWLVAHLFLLAGISEGQWSVFRKQRSWLLAQPRV